MKVQNITGVDGSFSRGPRLHFPNISHSKSLLSAQCRKFACWRFLPGDSLIISVTVLPHRQLATILWFVTPELAVECKSMIRTIPTWIC